jgi:hypothetical protein
MTPVMRRGALWVILALGCRGPGGDEGPPGDAAPPWDVARKPDPVRTDMVWIPPGVLVAGTPEGNLPRMPDAELAGVEVELGGYFIDRFNHPPEPGAIPLTGMTRTDAEAVCREQGKRLCTELEWERACKGPQNSVYEYGDEYDATACATGVTDALSPNGVNARCQSGFGVRDLHGSAWNWTASAWDRGGAAGGIAVRGGNGVEGDLVGRCANGRPVPADRVDKSIGVRCCAGEVNAAAVELDVARGPELEYRSLDRRLTKRLERFAPPEIVRAVQGMPRAASFRIERLWMWRPVGNEELIIGGGCAKPPGHDACGVVVARLGESGDGDELLGFHGSDWWIPGIGEGDEERVVFIYGGDVAGAFRKPLIYRWGRLGEGDKERKKGGGWVRP